MVKATVLDSLLGLLVMLRGTMLEMEKVQDMQMAMVLGMLLVKLLLLMVTPLTVMVLALGMVQATEQGMQLDTQATPMLLETTTTPLVMLQAMELGMLLEKLTLQIMVKD